jgi:type IV pilus assembly protein PilZ
MARNLSGILTLPMPEAPEAEEEKRTDDRAPITLKVDYKRLNTFFADYTKNISKGGTFIRTSKPLAVGTEFVFVLTLPEPSLDGAGIKLELTGQVKWVVTTEEATADNPHGMGIQFLYKTEAERQRVASFVADLMRTALGAHLADKLLAK